MSLRRTAMKRRAELKRTAMPRRRGNGQADRATRAIARARRTDTGPTAAQRRLVAERANYCCELCRTSLWRQGEGWTAPHSFHHRRPRGMGGTVRADTNSPANLLLLCGTGTTGCHGSVESNRPFALAMGWLLQQHQNPAAEAVVIDRGPVPSSWVRLDDAGNYLELTSPTS